MGLSSLVAGKRQNSLITLHPPIVWIMNEHYMVFTAFLCTDLYWFMVSILAVSRSPVFLHVRGRKMESDDVWVRIATQNIPERSRKKNCPGRGLASEIILLFSDHGFIIKAQLLVNITSFLNKRYIGFSSNCSCTPCYHGGLWGVILAQLPTLGAHVWCKKIKPMYKKEESPLIYNSPASWVAIQPERSSALKGSLFYRPVDQSWRNNAALMLT